MGFKFYRVNALLLKYWFITKNKLDRIFDMIYWPVIQILIWGFIVIFVEDISESNVKSWLLGAVIMWTFLWKASQDLAVYILEDHWSRSLYNVFSTPLQNSEIIVSVLIFSFLRGLATLIITVPLTWILYSYNFFTIDIFYLVIFAILLVLFGWVLGLIVAALVYTFGQRIQVLAWSVSVLIQPFSCVFYPLSSLPKWAQYIAFYIPTTHVFEGMRTLVNGQPINMLNISIAFITSIALLIITTWLFVKSIGKAKQKGLFTRYD